VTELSRGSVCEHATSIGRQSILMAARVIVFFVMKASS
jgi:hypothetical protein